MSLFKNLGLVILSLVATLLAAEFALRVFGIPPAYLNEADMVVSVQPDSFLVKDNVLGWRLGRGCYTTFLNKERVFSHCTDSNANRIILTDSGIHTATDKKVVHLYGCSFTFGYIVSDTGNFAYYLQKASPSIQVVNKGVPGYGLLQMFLSLKEEVKNNRRPDIAVFNWGGFQDERTPLNKQWSRAFKHAVIESVGKQDFEIDYPYASLKSDKTLEVKTMKWDEQPEDYPLRSKSSIVNVLNEFLDINSLKSQLPELKEVSYRLALEMKQYCKENNIELVFTSFDMAPQVFIEKLKDAEITTLYYEVDDSKKEYNCSPIDPSHPNSKAHKIYSEKLLALFFEKLWISQ